ncbi:MAG: IS66 family insertion sequence element accessory protein TnpB [Polyangiaceae bacterium]
MLLLPRAVRVYVAAEPVNLRKSFDGLTNEVREVLRGDPLSGHVFVFLNRRKTMVKLLLWTRGGFTIVQKRLERGTFTFPRQVSSEATSVEIDVHELGMLLEGIDARHVRVSKRWEPSRHKPVGLGVAAAP